MVLEGFRDVRDKVAIVTGAARGLGRGIAETLASEGVHVVMADIRPLVKEALAEVAQANPDNKGYPIELDVSDEAAIEKLVEGAVEKS